ncbi:MAG: hypothetical protein HZC28_13550 [Spirochaetes bacterium]|nr:hypothetical protein [Spirochaetota bacterium]
MRNIILCLLIAGTLVAAPHARVAVLSFTARGVSVQDADTVSDFFRTDLVNSKEFSVVDRGNMENILKEQALQATGCTDTECAVKIGKLLSVQYMISGNVSTFGGKFVLFVSMVNVETSEIVFSKREIAASLDDMLTVSRAMVISFVKSIKGDKVVTISSGAGKQNTGYFKLGGFAGGEFGTLKGSFIMSFVSNNVVTSNATLPGPLASPEISAAGGAMNLGITAKFLTEALPFMPFSVSFVVGHFFSSAEYSNTNIIDIPPVGYGKTFVGKIIEMNYFAPRVTAYFSFKPFGLMSDFIQPYLGIGLSLWTISWDNALAAGSRGSSVFGMGILPHAGVEINFNETFSFYAEAAYHKGLNMNPERPSKNAALEDVIGGFLMTDFAPVVDDIRISAGIKFYPFSF